ncbi:hypothetical protein OSB04_016576 [Centaurea solstitialis]|uniref:Uncharacterized protein n=1 Tax=Centaurea solstitialis TaxID=347529 RepID=A0AA38WL74_9ASTR|nr:hypothetical protein OSB04_016576 [Centaurea solstitialis]
MAAVARGHGGDAGVILLPAQGGYLHHANRRGRGRSRELKLIQAYDNNGKRPLPIEFDVNDQHTYQPIGDNDSLFIRDRYKDRKAKQKKHFMDNGGYNDVENARKHPPASVKKDVWDETIDRFLDPKYRNRAEKNAKNKAKARFPSLHGSSSYVSSRYKQKNPTTQELPGWIDNWRKMHTRSGEWVNDDARSCHDQMVAEKESLTQQQGSGSSTPIDESKILSKVLGEHRDHRTGRGRKLKGDSSSSIFDRSEYTTPPQRSFTDDQVRDMVSNFGAFIAHSQETHSALVQAIRNISPDADNPDIPTFSYTMPVVPPPTSTSPPIAPSSSPSPSPSPSSSQQNSNDDNEDLGNN